MRRRGWAPERIAGCWQLLGKGCISQRGGQSVDLRAGYGLCHIRCCKIYRNIADHSAKIPSLILNTSSSYLNNDLKTLADINISVTP